MLRWLVGKPLVYDAVQYAAGAGLIRRHLQPRLVETAGGIVLDIGAGTGIYSSCLPESARYVWFDNDPGKLEGFRRRRGRDCPAILGDATRIALADKSVDYTMCTHVTHHLTDQELSRFMLELARITRRKVILQDALDSHELAGRLLWTWDIGNHRRTRTALLTAFSERFHVEHTEEYARFHRYMLVVGSPR